MAMKLLLRSLLFLFLSCSQVFMVSAEETPLFISGRVKDAVTKLDLTDAYICLYDADGKLTDSIQANRGKAVRDGEIIDLSFFSFPVSRNDSTYVFDVVCSGYKTQTITYSVERVGKRETDRQMPLILMERAPRQLGEVTVTASKIKFYNKGDTIVYNADAFQLAEGSMLDALIAQLPGVELNDDGQIKVNGKFVESLLLNGKQFLDGNNQLMLENIGAYTVKNIEVYEGQTELEKWQDDPNSEKHLTMDVKLKREYNRGIILNAQGGFGTKDRYSGRLFSSLFTPTTELTLIANINNLNDTRKPGKNDTWTPERMPSGTRTYKMATFNYRHQNVTETKQFNGYATVEETSSNDLSTTARTNFLTGGNTYDNAFSRNHSRKLLLDTRNYLNFHSERFWGGGMWVARHARRDNNSSDISATFNQEQTDITSKALEALYSDASPERLDAIINRAITRSDGSRRETEFQAFPHLEYKIPRSRDRLIMELGMKYKDEKEERWRDYNINYGSDPVPAVTRRQYFDDSPNRSLTLDASVGYATNFRFGKASVSFSCDYQYRFVNHDKDSYMYALDALADMGIYGTLPGNYLDSFDPSNSYTSREINNRHTISPRIMFHMYSYNSMLTVHLSPDLGLLHQHFDYWRANRSYLVSRNSFLATVKNYRAKVEYRFGRVEEGKRVRYSNTLTYDYTVDTKTPDLVHMVDVVNDADPLNIALGNPDLKNSYIQTHSLSWNYISSAKPLNNTLRLNYSTTADALVRGYTYDTSTGIRRNRTYNLDGNNSLGASNTFNLQFGPKQQFSVSSSTDGTVMNYADMIGVNREEPEKSSVRSTNLSERLKLDWQIGKQQIGLNVSVTNRHTTSSREDFNSINANHYNYGILGQFRLPGGFGLNTDFTLYTRRGYGVKQLDTTDAIWNLRLTYTPKGGHWVFMVDGFDMLHQLSNVNYAVSASGRTVTYTNALPRYIMCSVQYRLNIQPKRR